jgi:predicted aspartyl protease
MTMGAISTVPMKLAGGAAPLILLPAHVNGEGPFDFILDTGASTSLLATDVASRVGVTVDETKEATGAGGAIPLGIGSVRSIAVGSARREDLRVGVTDEVRRLGAIVRHNVDGDLGYDLLSAFRLTIDYRAMTVAFDGGARSAEEADGLPFTIAGTEAPLILVPVMVNGEGPFDFVLDTGAAATCVSERTAERLGLERRQAPSIQGGGGAVAAGRTRLRSLAVGAWEQRDLPAATAGFFEMLGDKVGRRLDGIVGYNFLRNYLVTIDYPASRLHLEALSVPASF